MEKKWWILVGIGIVILLVLFFGYKFIVSQMSCSLDSDFCEDGSSVSRVAEKFCGMGDCPKIITCDSNSDCPQDYICLEQKDRDKPACHYTKGFETPCIHECGILNCTLTGTDPVQAICSES